MVKYCSEQQRSLTWNDTWTGSKSQLSPSCFMPLFFRETNKPQSTHPSFAQRTEMQHIKRQTHRVDQAKTNWESSLTEQFSVLLISTSGKWCDQLIIWFTLNGWVIHKRQLWFSRCDPQSRDRGAFGVTDWYEDAKRHECFNLHLYWRLTGTFKIGPWGSKTNFLMRVEEKARQTSLERAP